MKTETKTRVERMETTLKLTNDEIKEIFYFLLGVSRHPDTVIRSPMIDIYNIKTMVLKFEKSLLKNRFKNTKGKVYKLVINPNEYACLCNYFDKFENDIKKYHFLSLIFTDIFIQHNEQKVNYKTA